LKIILGALAAIISICSVIYYLTLYPAPLTLADPIGPTPTATAIVPLVTVTPEIISSNPVKEESARRITAKQGQTNRVQRLPSRTNPLSRQKWPLGKPKASPRVIKPKATPVK